VIKRLIVSLEINRKHQAQYEWRDLMRKIDLTMSDHPNNTCVICTDFGTTLDLGASEKDNSSVNNHAVIAIFLVSHNWRQVIYKKRKESGENDDDVTIVNDCDKWIFFGDMRSKGKKNDHVFHHACMKHIISQYGNDRMNAGLPYVEINKILCGQTTVQHNTSSGRTSTISLISPPCIVHKFAQKFRFKGSWDATGKVVEMRIENNELKYVRVADAWDCYRTLCKQLTKDGSEKLILDLEQYEIDGDETVLKNTTFTTKRTLIGYVTEDINEQQNNNTIILCSLIDQKLWHRK
jgi:hypothetical protein